MSDTDLVMYRGDDRSFTITVSGIDVTDAEVYFTAKRTLEDPDDQAVIRLETPSAVEVLSPTQIRVNIPKEATADLTAQVKLYWDLQVCLGEAVRTLPEPNTQRSTLGTLLIRPDVTRSLV